MTHGMGILAAEYFSICYTFHTTNKKSPGQLVFGEKIIVPIEHVANWGLIYQCFKKVHW